VSIRQHNHNSTLPTISGSSVQLLGSHLIHQVRKRHRVAATALLRRNQVAHRALVKRVVQVKSMLTIAIKAQQRHPVKQMSHE
jgi:hypothetical protein